MEYGYIRVSSMGQNVARQVDALHEAGIDDCRIFTDKMSGKSFNRPAWKRLVKRLKSGDLLVVQSLDRLGRNYEEILEQWRILIKVKGVDIRILNMPLLDTANKTNGLIGKLVADLVLQLFSFVAESERVNIKERQRQAINAAMKRGVKFGRPKIGNAREIAECVARIKNGSLSQEKIHPMMYKFIELPDKTEITHSDRREDGTVKVCVEKPVDGDFKTAYCELPSYRWHDVEGYSKDELEEQQKTVESLAHLIIRFSHG